VDPRGKGDIGESHVRWRMKAPILQLATPVLKDGLLYTVDSKNYFYVLDAENGQVRYSERLKGKYHSSPIWADGHIYLSSTRGFTRVYQAGESPEFLAENRLEGEIWATPAFVDSCIYLRTSDYLYGLKVR